VLKEYYDHSLVCTCTESFEYFLRKDCDCKAVEGLNIFENYRDCKAVALKEYYNNSPISTYEKHILASELFL
jgi:hypothetical protein